PELDRELPLEHQEEIVSVRMRMPDERPLELRHHHIIAVVACHDLRRKIFGKRAELGIEIDCCRHLILSPMCPDPAEPKAPPPELFPVVIVGSLTSSFHGGRPEGKSPVCPPESGSKASTEPPYSLARAMARAA